MPNLNDFALMRQELARLDQEREGLSVSASSEEEREMARDDTPAWREFISR